MFYSELEKIVLAYPKKSWNMILLSQNPNIRQEFMDNHPEFDWNQDSRYCNPNITERFICQHPEINWDYKVLSIFHHLSYHFIDTHIHEDWDFEILSIHPNIDFTLVSKHKQVPWNYDIFCSDNQSLSYTLYCKYSDFPWSKKYLIRNKKITWQNVIQSDLWEYASEFSHNSNITLQIIKENPLVKWNWNVISRTIVLDETTLEEKLPWNYYWLSSNPSLTWEIIDKFKGEDWDLHYLFTHFEINEERLYDFVKKNRLSMDWYGISFNKETPLSILEKYSSVVIWDYVGMNHNLNLEFIQENEEFLDCFELLSYNSLHYYKKLKENETLHYYESLWSLCETNFKIYEEELIQKTWHPSRFMDWCLNNDEKEDVSYSVDDV